MIDAIARLRQRSKCIRPDTVSSRDMPTVLRSGPYRVYFYSHEPNEPPHVHVDRDERSAKFWLAPVALASNLGFSARELRRIEALIRDNQRILSEAWRGYHGD